MKKILVPVLAGIAGGGVYSAVTANNHRTAPAYATSGSAYYRNCSAARAAGAAPIRVGAPGYRRKLDRDGDGIACE